MLQFCSDLTRTLRSGVVLAAVLCLAAVSFLFAKDFVKPSAKPAATYTLHDQHSDENVAAGVDPYDDPEKAQIFNVKWAEEGFLPIFLIVTNDSDQPVLLSGMQAQIVTNRREKITAATTDELYRRLAHPNASRPKYPLPFPRTTVKGAVGKKALDEMNAA
ncbi:MAG TPA: hypothetical protein VLL05_08150, partial [Terriglobales bacterium]|nr:hypothetical protein [Terriglobales bacterium]